MLSHHSAWLAVHPERSSQWLADRIADGFHVHHIDGDHENNDPLNLVLIESGDHMMLHNGSKRLLWMPPVKRGKRKLKKLQTIEGLQEKLQPMLEAVERKKKKALRIKLRDIGRALYASNRTNNYAAPHDGR